jgi:hypothetical protein
MAMVALRLGVGLGIENGKGRGEMAMAQPFLTALSGQLRFALPWLTCEVGFLLDGCLLSIPFFFFLHSLLSSVN